MGGIMTTIIIAANKKDAQRYAKAHPELPPATFVFPSTTRTPTAHAGPVHVTAAGRAHTSYKTMLNTAAPAATIVHVEPNQTTETGESDTAPRPQAPTSTTKTTHDTQNPDTEEVAGGLYP